LKPVAYSKTNYWIYLVPTNYMISNTYRFSYSGLYRLVYWY